MLITETSNSVLLLSLALACAESEDGEDAQRHILVSILGGQDRLLTTVNVALPAVVLLLTNLLLQNHGLVSHHCRRIAFDHSHRFTPGCSRASPMLYFFPCSRIDANSALTST